MVPPWCRLAAPTPARRAQGTSLSTSESEPATDNSGGFGAPSQAAGEFAGAITTYPVTGSLRLADNGCWYVEINDIERLVALPVGYELDAVDSAVLRGPDQRAFRHGDPVDGSARFFREAQLPGGVDGKWSNYVDFCGPELREVAVFDDLAPAFDPAELTVGDFVDIVEAAEFDQQWPCGRGWATSTPDQRVGLLIYQIDDQQPTPGDLVELPNPGWTAELVIGKHLFANHCNDAIEEWMPQPARVAQFAVAGAVILHDAAPDVTDPPAAVTATLAAASIDIDGRRISLPDIELRNERYNAFAG